VTLSRFGGVASAPRRRPNTRPFLIQCEERTVTVLAKPGQRWVDAFNEARANYQAICAALDAEPLPMTPIGRVKL